MSAWPWAPRPFVWVAIVLRPPASDDAPDDTPAAPVATPLAPAASASTWAGRSLVCVASAPSPPDSCAAPSASFPAPVRRALRALREVLGALGQLAGPVRQLLCAVHEVGCSARCRAGLVDELLEPGDQLAGHAVPPAALSASFVVEVDTEPASLAAAESESWAELTARSTSPT